MTRRDTTRLVLCWAAVPLLLALAAQGAPGAPDEAPAFRILEVGKTPARGRLTGWSGETLEFRTGDRVATVPLGRLRTLEAENPAPPILGERPHLRVTLTGGERILGTLAETTSDGLVLQTPDLGRVPLLLDVVSTVVVVPADAGVCSEPEHRFLADEDDIAYVQSGDAFIGIVLAVDDRGFEFETVVRGRTRLVSWDDLLVLHLQNDPPDPVRGLQIEVETIEGSRLTAAGEVQLVDDALRFALRSSPDTVVRVPLTGIRTVRPSGGAFVYATMLPFESELVWYYSDDESEQAFTEAFRKRWYAARVDRTPDGCPLRIAGQAYRHGFAVHSRSRITLHLGGTWSRFETLFGVDDEAPELENCGIVDARVLGDGKVLWEARDVRRAETPRKVGPLDVGDVQALVLEVDFGKEEHRGDRAAWADPLLFR